MQVYLVCINLDIRLNVGYIKTVRQTSLQHYLNSLFFNNFDLVFFSFTGILASTNLEKIAYIIARDWKTIAQNLGLSNDDICKIITTEIGLTRQTLRMLDTWRFSDVAVLSSVSPVVNLCNATKMLKCTEELQDLIKDN